MTERGFKKYKEAFKTHAKVPLRVVPEQGILSSSHTFFCFFQKYFIKFIHRDDPYNFPFSLLDFFFLNNEHEED